MHSGIAFSTNDTCDDTLTFGIAFASEAMSMMITIVNRVDI